MKIHKMWTIEKLQQLRKDLLLLDHKHFSQFEDEDTDQTDPVFFHYESFLYALDSAIRSLNS